MNAYLKLSVGAAVAALAALTIRNRNADLALLLGIVGCCLGGLLVLEFLSPVVEFAQKLYRKTGLENELLAPMLKSAGVALLTQISAAICADAGQSALARLVELGGAALCLLFSLPLMSAVLRMLEQMAGG